MTSSAITLDVNERDLNDETALYRAAAAGDAADVERLLAAGADPNTRNGWQQRTPLRVAKCVEVVRLLVDHGADIVARPNERVSPLRDHCYFCRTLCVEFLCFKGVDVNHRDDRGWTPIFCAVEVGNSAAFEILVAFDADVNVTNNGYTPLMWAAHVAAVDCVPLLLALNADTTKVHEDGWTVSQTTNKAIQQLLLGHSNKSEKERQELRLETLQRIQHKVGIQLMRYAQPEIIGICIAMSSLELPPYVLLWIIDWLPNYDRLSHHKKIHLIESVRNSIWKIKERKEVRQRFGLRQRKKY